MINNKQRLKPEIRIAKMSAKDINALLEIGKAHWKDESWLTRNYIKSSFVQPGASYVVKSENKVIGGIIFVYEDIVKNWIRYLIVEEKYRRQGVGKALLQKIFGKTKKGESIFLDTGTQDKGTIAFYQKLGFKKCGMARGLYGKKSAYFLKKTIR